MREGKHKEVFTAHLSVQNSLTLRASKVVFFSFHFFVTAVKDVLEG